MNTAEFSNDMHKRPDIGDVALHPSSESKNAEWHVGVHGSPVGPMTWEKMVALFQSGDVDGETLIWRDGFPDWKPAQTEKDLAPLFKAAPAPPVPRPSSARNSSARRSSEAKQKLSRTAPGIGTPSTPGKPATGKPSKGAKKKRLGRQTSGTEEKPERGKKRKFTGLRKKAGAKAPLPPTPTSPGVPNNAPLSPPSQTTESRSSRELSTSGDNTLSRLEGLFSDDATQADERETSVFTRSSDGVPVARETGPRRNSSQEVGVPLPPSASESNRLSSKSDLAPPRSSAAPGLRDEDFGFGSATILDTRSPLHDETIPLGAETGKKAAPSVAPKAGFKQRALSSPLFIRLLFVAAAAFGITLGVMAGWKLFFSEDDASARGLQPGTSKEEFEEAKAKSKAEKEATAEELGLVFTEEELEADDGSVIRDDEPNKKGSSKASKNKVRSSAKDLDFSGAKTAGKSKMRGSGSGVAMTAKQKAMMVRMKQDMGSGAADLGMANVNTRRPQQKKEGLGAKELGSVIRKNRPALSRCYTNATKGMQAPPSVRMDIQVTVGATGKVRGVNIRGKDVGTLSSCLRSRITKWRFPSSGDASTVKFPLVFQAGS